MFRAIVLATTYVMALAAKPLAEDHTTFTDFEAIIKHVNQPGSTWTAVLPSRFQNVSIASQKLQLGAVLPGDFGYEPPEKFRQESKVMEGTIPESFDVRTNWPECAAITGHVRDQSSCGSCWAFSTTTAFNDRYCIKHGDAATLFSPEHTNSCCSGSNCGGSAGCQGGQPSGAWRWFTTAGVVSGGDYADVGQGTSCQPYSMMTCAHHVTPPEGMIDCGTIKPEYSTPRCSNQCEAGYGTAFSADKKKAASSYGVTGVANIQRELMDKGSVSVSYSVYSDFETYSSGIYQHKTGEYLGGHAVKLIGWGTDGTTPYWICTNSWNDSWGEQGTFRILRGSDECGIESDVQAGDA